MQIETFFKDDMICQQGDINETIYFVHQGTVDVLFLTETEEIKVDQLEELDCFGIIQGLFPKTPHTHSFRATTVTVLITLKLGDWYMMLQFFPASKFYIYDKMSAMH
ncbi:PREDICTED: uncharacterized protein LOC108558398 [Nicrophorus vespilloides]|uniref:Uncharacterized protein LOC108558398 n=1 Tax=Nicrophorus vespilloides TaxID=110193 RepID=A0ABM1M891_NICVS|nr:PREDICTED: uncharacterized protein LOC108558398 [Nicrophorus vespilloides]